MVGTRATCSFFESSLIFIVNGPNFHNNQGLLYGRAPRSRYFRMEQYLLLAADATPGDVTFWATVAFSVECRGLLRGLL